MYYIIMLKNPHMPVMVFAVNYKLIPYDYYNILFHPRGNAVESFNDCVKIMNYIREYGHVPQGYYWN